MKVNRADAVDQRSLSLIRCNVNLESLRVSQLTRIELRSTIMRHIGPIALANGPYAEQHHTSATALYSSPQLSKADLLSDMVIKILDDTVRQEDRPPELLLNRTTHCASKATFYSSSATVSPSKLIGSYG